MVRPEPQPEPQIVDSHCHLDFPQLSDELDAPRPLVRPFCTYSEVTEKELDKLPDDVRPHVERMLGRITSGVKIGQRPVASSRVAVEAPGVDRVQE